MAWTDNVVNALHQGDCFVSSIHRANFIQLFDEIKHYPFFTRELCKCAFTASAVARYANGKGHISPFIQRIAGNTGLIHFVDGIQQRCFQYGEQSVSKYQIICF